MNFKSFLTTAVITFSVSGVAQAATFTTISPTSAGELPAGVSTIGGVVTDLVGLNGNRVVSQLSATSLFEGFVGATNPLTIGTQSGFGSSITDALGGGIAEAAFRVSLFDGDSAPGDFDFNDNSLLVNGLNFGNFSDVQTVETTPTGDILSGPDAGFANGDLDTGFFTSSDATLLSSLFTDLVATETLVFGLDDEDLPPAATSQFFDFTQGIDASLIDVGSAPVVTPPVAPSLPTDPVTPPLLPADPSTPTGAIPEPFTIVGASLALGLGGMLRRKFAS